MLSMFSLKYFLFIQEELSALGHQSPQHSKKESFTQYNGILSSLFPDPMAIL